MGEKSNAAGKALTYVVLIVLAILIIVLLVKPSGIMGKNEGEKV